MAVFRYSVDFLVICLVAWLCAAGCVHREIGRKGTDSLIEQMSRGDLADSYRLRVIGEVFDRTLDPAQNRQINEILCQIVASPLHSPVIRSMAVKLLAERYSANSAVCLAKALAQTAETSIRNEILDSLVQLNDPCCIDGLIVALGREPKEGAIAATIEKISHAQTDEVLTERLGRSDAPLSVRIAAVGTLVRSIGLTDAIGAVTAIETQDDFVEGLRFWAEGFGYLPTNGPRFMICHMQRSELTGEQKQRVRAIAGELGRRDGYIFDPRDSYVILSTPALSSVRPRGELVGSIARRLGELSHTKRPESYKGAPDDYREGFDGQAERLSYVDLLRVRYLLDSMAAEECRGQLRALLAASQDDLDSEIGGLCFLKGERVDFEPYEPGDRVSANRYIESDEMVIDGCMSFARWHCHADPWRGSELAGPGVDDMAYATYVNNSVVIVTLLDFANLAGGEATFCNVDYLSADGIVVDLGNY